jgi:hypothetical protein
MYYTVYQSTNNINFKEYIGAHATSKLDDGYMGSGKHFKNAVKRYGKENFSKEIIFRAVSEDIMYWIEEMIVDRAYVDSKNTYNKKLGGRTGSGANRFTPFESALIYENRRNSGNWVKGKSYEEIMGKEKADKLKEEKSLHFSSIDRSGSKNSRAGKVKIYNSEDELMFECHGNFRKITEENNLPQSALLQSYLNNGKKIYVNITDNGNIDQLTQKGYFKYKGWYAIKE